METVRKIANGALIFVTAVAVFLSCLLLYFNTLGEGKLPTAITSTYATTITDLSLAKKSPC